MVWDAPARPRVPGGGLLPGVGPCGRTYLGIPKNTQFPGSPLGGHYTGISARQGLHDARRWCGNSSRSGGLLASFGMSSFAFFRMRCSFGFECLTSAHKGRSFFEVAADGRPKHLRLRLLPCLQKMRTMKLFAFGFPCRFSSRPAGDSAANCRDRPAGSPGKFQSLLL